MAECHRLRHSALYCTATTTGQSRSQMIGQLVTPVGGSVDRLSNYRHRSYLPTRYRRTNERLTMTSSHRTSGQLSAWVAVAAVVTLSVAGTSCSAQSEERVVKGSTCAVTSAALAALGTAISRGKSGKALSAALGGGAGAECAGLFDEWAAGNSGTLIVQTPNGQTISEIIYQSQLAAGLPMDSASVSRRTQCAGWASMQSFYDLCISGQIAPLYR